MKFWLFLKLSALQLTHLSLGRTWLDGALASYFILAFVVYPRSSVISPVQHTDLSHRRVLARRDASLLHVPPFAAPDLWLGLAENALRVKVDDLACYSV